MKSVKSERTFGIPYNQNTPARKCLEDPEFKTYYNNICKIPFLSPEETKTLFVQAQQGDEEARNRIVSANLRLVIMVVCRYFLSYTNQGINIMDMIQEGDVGLMEAIKKFNPAKGSFSTYACYWIQQYINRAIHYHEHSVHIPIHIVNECRKVKRTQDKYPDISVEELIEQTGYSKAAIKRGLRYNQTFLPALSLNKICDYEDTDDNHTKKEYLDQLTDSAPSSEDIIIKKEKLNAVKFALEKVSRRNTSIFLCRLTDPDKHTLQSLGDRYHITRERVRQIEERILGIVQRNGTIKDLAQP